jgi:hypothetical protein
MKENKLTPEEIKKALECCTPSNESCLNCPLIDVSVPECARILYKATIDLINRQQAEIERLTINMNAFGLGMKQEKERADTIRAEAIKEFVEKLQEKADDIGIDEDGFLFTISAEWKIWFRVGDWCEEIIDNLVKEMAGDDK